MKNTMLVNDSKSFLSFLQAHIIDLLRKRTDLAKISIETLKSNINQEVFWVVANVFNYFLISPKITETFPANNHLMIMFALIQEFQHGF